jgi:ABC-type bacteriocin/lantibiotic exporter with double-glycine peptidase domain
MKRRVHTKMFTLIRQRWRIFLLATLAATLAQIVGIPLALLSRKMVKLVANETQQNLSHAQIEHTLWLLGSMLVGLTIFRGLCRWIRGVLGEIFAQRTIADLRKEMLTHIYTLSMGYFDKRAAGKIVIRFVGDAQGLRGWLAIKLVSIPADILTILGVLAAIYSIDHRLFLAVFIPPLVLLPVLLFVNPRARRWTRVGRREQSRLTGDLTERVGMIAAVKASNSQAESVEPLKKRIDTIADALIRRSFLDAWGQAVSLTVGSLSLCAIGIWGSLLILNNQAATGDIVGALWLTVLLRSPINRLTSTNIAYQRVKVAIDRIDALLSRKPEPGAQDGLEPYTALDMRIRFKDMGYRNLHDQWIIHQLTQTITGPGSVLIRGDRDSTNTLFELILRIRRPHEGRIALDGVNARKLRLFDIRANIGWVDANRKMIPATLFAHEMSTISPWLNSTSMISESLPTQQDLDRVMDHEHPARIHSGVGIRLALACALVNDPRVLLLDRPDDGLSKAEIEGLQVWLEEECKHRLILIATDKSWARAAAMKTVRLKDE